MKSDFDFIKEKLQEEKTALPASLSRENIVRRVEGETQEKREGRLRRYVPLIASVAAVFVILAVFAVVGFAGGPTVLPPSSGDLTETDVLSPAEKAKSYAEIGKILKRNQNSDGIVWKGGVWYDTSKSAPDGAVEDDAIYEEAPAAVNAASEHSELNTRTEGVDEEDYIRTDGAYIYILNGRRFSWARGFLFAPDGQTFTVVDPNGGHSRKISETELIPAAQEEKTPVQRKYTGFFLYKKLVLLIGQEISFEGGTVKYNAEEKYWDFYGDVTTKSVSLVTVYDLSDPAAPVFVKDLYFDGDFVSARVIGDRLITAGVYAPATYGIDYKDYTTFIPRAGDDESYIDAAKITVADGDASQFFTVSVTNLSDLSASPESIAILGAMYYEIYCSREHLYAYGTHMRLHSGKKWRSVLSVNKIDVSGDAPVLVGSADFYDATLNDSFCIDEYDGFLRLSLQSYSTSGDLRNYVTVLDKEMKVLGRSEDIGVGEQIKSVRFSGDMAYVVTFRNTDPLFAIDLSDPENPVVLGEVKLPGYSAYMHPAGEGLMVGVGYDGTETGVNGDGKISLFDVSDPENPKEIDRLILKGAYLNSDYKTILTRENGFFVTFRKYSYNGAAREGMVYFTVEDERLVEKSTILLDEPTMDGRTLFIGDVLYYYASFDRETYSDAEGAKWETGYFLNAYDLNTGEMISKLLLSET